MLAFDRKPSSWRFLLRFTDWRAVLNAWVPFGAANIAVAEALQLAGASDHTIVVVLVLVSSVVGAVSVVLVFWAGFVAGANYECLTSSVRFRSRVWKR